MKSEYLYNPACCWLVDKHAQLTSYFSRSGYKLGSRHMMMVNMRCHGYDLMQHRFIEPCYK